jgi:protease-4
MLQFLKYTLATVTGLILFSVLGILLIIGIASGLSKKTATEVKPKTVLRLDFKDEIVERATVDPFARIRGDMVEKEGLNEILENIRKAKEDENVGGILLDLGIVNAGAASREEIRYALKEFKSAGKFIYAKADYYYNANYSLASLADKIFITPTGEMIFNGTAAQPMFYKGMLDKIGVELQVVRHGKFKGAVEPFIKEHLSEENRLQIRRYKEAVYSNFMANIAEDRKMDVNTLYAIADELKVRSPEDAKSLGLIDELAYADQVEKALREKLGLGEKDKISYLGLSKYKNAPGKKKEGDASNKIAVIYAQGEIRDGEGDNETIGGTTLAETVAKARNDDKIKAIVLRINSPGGSAMASDIIWREVKLAAEKKPLIVSMGDVAASGGYYIAAPAAFIYAEPSTITGSIGVFGLYPNIGKLLNDKLGITTDTVKIGKYSDLGNTTRQFTEDEKQIFQAFIERTYDDFITRVAEGRHKNKADIDSIAQGRVWAAADALNLGLVDKIGSLDDAIKLAAEKAGVSSYRITEMPKLKDPVEELLNSFNSNSRLKAAMKKELGDNYQYYEQLRSLQGKHGIRMELVWW